ncbi:MAG: class I SAM-dependent methyltransferase [Gammaproteobacteria bacterium]|nr:class I SAM-dependent methyltransferase [Gammaproteobacteria bacterium]NNF60777.1 class I SAM-dependent methyltransferase [Gammaproteobacteria bacterium]NNM20212.1 class I SAM-dependent methyltransferase [Gammaproteobacteria bacterium]
MSDVPAANEVYPGVENLEAMRHARRYNNFLIDLICHYTSGSRLMDFGAGAGTFAASLKERGRNVVCIEPAAALRERLAADGLEAHQSTTGLSPDSVDSVYTLNVLEHIGDDLGAVKEMTRCLRPGGRLLIYVPAFQLLFGAMDRRVGHLRRYRRRALVRIVRQAGLKVETARYADSLGFLAALAYRFIGDDSGVISPRSVRVYDRFLFPVSRLVDQLTLGSFGKNVLVVASKPDVT